MMTLVDAANILYEELSRINVELFSDRHIQFVYNDTYGADVAILSHIAFNNAQRHKMDAMRQYCYNVRKCPGSPFIVTDKAFRLFQEKGMKTSFGSSLQRGDIYSRSVSISRGQRCSYAGMGWNRENKCSYGIAEDKRQCLYER